MSGFSPCESDRECRSYRDDLADVEQLLKRAREDNDRLLALLGEAYRYIDARGPKPGLVEGDAFDWLSLVERLRKEVTGK